MATLIANPIYDSVFKYLMEDQRVAKVILSDLLQRDVLEVDMKNNEKTQPMDGYISVLRIDFGAKVRDANGNVENVNIEMQKSWLTSEIIRFRNYLATQYSSSDNRIIISDKPLKEKQLHIVSIYLLGHEVEGLDNAVTYVYPKMYDQYGKPVGKEVKEVDFVNELVHDMIVVQIPKIPKTKVKSRLDKLLTLFDQSYMWQSNHQLRVDESKYVGDHKYVFRRLLRAQADQDIIDGMDIEDIYQVAMDEKEQEIELKEREIAIQKERIANQNEQIASQSKELHEQKETLVRLTNSLLLSGKTIEEVAEIMNVPIERVRQLVKKHS